MVEQAEEEKEPVQIPPPEANEISKDEPPPPPMLILPPPAPMEEATATAHEESVFSMPEPKNDQTSKDVADEAEDIAKDPQGNSAGNNDILEGAGSAEDVIESRENEGERGRRASNFYVLPTVEAEEGEEEEGSDVLNVRVEFQDELFHVQVGKSELDQLTIGDLKSRQVRVMNVNLTYTNSCFALLVNLVSSRVCYGKALFTKRYFDHSVCFKITALTNTVVRPENIVLSINDAPLRNHWTCAEVYLHANSTLTASVSKATLGFSKNATTPLFSLHVDIDDRVETIHVRNGDVPELLATAFTRMQGLDAAYVPPIVAEIYRGLSKVFATEVAILQTKLRQQQDSSVLDIDKGRESIIHNQEQLLDQAGEQIKRLRAENDKLQEELREVRMAQQSRRLEVESPAF